MNEVMQLWDENEIQYKNVLKMSQKTLQRCNLSFDILYNIKILNNE